MTILTSFSGLDWTERIGLTLLHSLWLIALIAALFAVIVTFLQRRSAQLRYLVGCLALFAMLLAPTGTYLLLSTAQPFVDASPRAVATANHHEQSSETIAAPGHDDKSSAPTAPTEPSPSTTQPSLALAESVAPPDSPAAAKSENALSGNLSTALRNCLPWATSLWIFGVVLLSLRPFWGWQHALRLQRRGTSPLPDTLDSLALHVLRRLKVSRTVRFAESILVEVPTVIGFLRPIVLLPASAVSGLTALEIEFVLAHELAHIRRHDWLVNLAQIVIEALLFYHPAMWWVSSEIRKERENCCDDAAVAVCGDPPTCARALAHLEELRGTTPVVAMAANGGSLITRIRRLVGKPASPCNRRFGICLAGPSALAIAAMIIVFAMATGGAEEPPVVGGDTLAEPESTPKPTFTLTVLDHQDNPIPHAKVNHGRVDRDKKRVHFSRTADESGVVVLDTTPPENIGWFSFSVKTPGYAPFYGQWDNWDSNDLPPQQFSVRLKKGKTIGGVVHDEHGKPVEGVKVEFSFPYGPDGMRVDDGTGCAARGTTDAEGRWTCGYVPLSLFGTKQFTLNHSNHKTCQYSIPLSELLPEENGAHNRVMLIRKGTAVSGAVRDEEGRPIADAEVYVEFVHMSGTEKDCLRQTKTDQDGEYRVDNCPIGPVMVAVESPGYATQAQSCEITEKPEPVDIAMKSQRPLTLRVLDQQGQPIEDASFYVRSWQGCRWINRKLLSRDSRTGVDGRFTWNSAPRDEMQIETTAPEYMSSKAASVKSTGQEHVFKLHPALSVSGTVTEKTSGQPIPEFKVIPGIFFTNTPHGVHWQPRNLENHTDGKYATRWRHPYAGYALRVEAEGYLPEVSRKIEISEGTVELDLALEKATEEHRQEKQDRRRPRGVVLTPDGQPAAGATLGFATARMGIYIRSGVLYEEPHRFLTHADDQGRFTSPSLTPKDRFQPKGNTSADGTLILPDSMVALHESGFACLDYNKITLAKNKTMTAFEPPIQLQKWARVEGRVMLGDKPAVECPVNLQVEGPVAPDGSGVRRSHSGVMYAYQVTTDHQGRFVFDRVPPGMKGSVARTIAFARDAGSSSQTGSHAVPLVFKAGETTDVQIGGTGRPVIGALQYAEDVPDPIDWEFALVRINPKHADNQRYPRCSAVDSEGRFRVEDVLPGDYVLSVEVTNPRSRHDRSVPRRSLRQEFPLAVPDHPPNEPVDTGVLHLHGLPR
jgi:beta-lactamase regulating signal transducer with metallopeptidase domain/uncharacterized GH25 family protein